MYRSITAIILVVGLVFLTAERRHHHPPPPTPSPTPTPPPPTLAFIIVNPSSATLYTLDATQQFTATGIYSDSTQRDISGSCAWSTTDPSIATISSSGLATSINYGGPINITCADP